MNFDVKKRDPHSRGQSDVGPRNNGGYYGPSRNFASMTKNYEGPSERSFPAETNDDPVAGGGHKRIEEQPCAREQLYDKDRGHELMEKNGGFSWSITAPETMMNNDVDEMSMKIPVMGIINMMVICVLLSMERISLQEISGSSTSMMEEKTMDIKDIFARHGFRLCPLTNADANKLKLDFDELRDSVASQSVAVAGDGGGSVLYITLCAGKIQ